MKMTDPCSNPDLESKIIMCMVRRLSTKEALEYLKENGYEIPERTYFEHKKKLKERKSERITNVVDDLIWKHFELMDTLELIQSSLWKDLEQANDVNLRLKIQNAIKDNQLLISKCYDAMLPVTNRQIESYAAVSNAHQLTYADYRKFNLEIDVAVLKNRIDRPYKDRLALPDPEEEFKKEKEEDKKQLKRSEEALEHLTRQEAAAQKFLPTLPKTGLNPKKKEGGPKKCQNSKTLSRHENVS